MMVNLQPLEELIQFIESDVGLTGSCRDEPDSESVGWSEDGPMPMTFGHVRRARASLDQLLVSKPNAQPK